MTQLLELDRTEKNILIRCVGFALKKKLFFSERDEENMQNVFDKVAELHTLEEYKR